MGRTLKMGLGAVALGALLAVGGWYAVDARVRSNVEARFTSLRVAGTEASHGAVAFDLFSRTVRIADIVIAATAGDYKVGNLTIEGVDLTASDLIARRAVLDSIDVTVKAAMDTRAASDTKLRVPKIEASDVRILATPLDLDVAKSPLERWATHFAAVSAKSVTIPAVTLSMSLPSALATTSPMRSTVQGDLGRVDFAYSDVRIDDLADGAAKRVSYGKTTMTGSAGTPLVAGSLDAASVADVDVLPIFGLGLSRRTARDGIYRMQGAGTMGTMTMSMIDGGSFTIGGSTFGEAGINPKAFSIASLEKLTAISSQLGTKPPTPDDLKVIMAAVADLYEGLAMAGVEMRDLRFVGPRTLPPADLAIDKIAVGNWNKGKLSTFRIEGLRGRSTESPGKSTPFKVGLFAIDGLDLVRIIRASQLVAPGVQPSPESLAQLMQSIEGVEVGGIVVPSPAGQIVEVDRLKARWGSFINGVPTQVEWLLHGTLPLAPGDPSVAPLREAGIPKLQVKATSTIGWLEGENAARAKADIAIVQLGSIQLDAKVDKIPRQSISLVPGQFAAAVPDFQPAGLTVTVRDAGMLNVIARATSGQLPSGGPAQDATGIADMLKMTLVDPSHANGSLAKALDAFGQFLQRPKQGFSLELRPKLPITLVQLFAPGMLQTPGALAEFFETLDVKAQVTTP